MTMSGDMDITLVSRAKEKLELRVRLKLRLLPCLVSAWQKSKHFVEKEESTSLTVYIVMFLGKSYINELNYNADTSEVSCSILF